MREGPGGSFYTSLFSGHVVPRHNIKAVSDNTFFYIGIVQTGDVLITLRTVVCAAWKTVIE